MTIRDILLVEDEAIIAMDMEMTLEAHGFSVLGPCNSIQAARSILTTQRPDLAVLDVNLGSGETSFPLAEELCDMGVPVVFLSGYSSGTVEAPPRLKGAARLIKPVTEADLLAAIKRAGLAEG